MTFSSKRAALVVAIALIGAAIGAAAPSAYAADTVNVSDGKVYTVGDLTGDGSEDTIKVKATAETAGGWYTDLKVYINDAIVLSDGDFSSTPGMFDAEILTSDAGKSVLYLMSGYGSRVRPYHGLYTFGDGKLQTAVNFESLYPVGQGVNSTVSIKGETLTATIMQNGFYGYDPASDCFDYTVKYKWVENKLKRVSDTCKVTNSGWTSTSYRTYKLYKAPGSKKVVTTVKKGTKAKGLQIRFVGSKCYMQVKTKSGKVGWYRGRN